MPPPAAWGSYVRPGDRVVVKPNIGWDRSPEQGANTHPAVVRAIVEQVLEAGAARVLVFDRTCNEPRRCYKNSGIEDALSSLGNKVRVEHIDERKFVPVEVARGKALTELSIYRDALEADCYINVPVAKHHGLSRLTLGLKNSMGVLGGNRGQMHHGIGQKLADLATVLRPTLNVIDATRMLMDNGPQGGRLDGRAGRQHDHRLRRPGGGGRLCHHPVRPQARRHRVNGGRACHGTWRDGSWPDADRAGRNLNHDGPAKTQHAGHPPL